MYRSKIATTVETISNVTGQRTLVNDSIQIALDRVFQSHDWPYYMQEAAIKTATVYNTGTANVTQDSTSVPITTGVVTSTYAGRKFRVKNDKPYYKILSVAGNTLTLEQPFQGTTNATASYEIFKDEFRLSPDVDKYKLMRQIQNGIPMWDMTPTTFDERFPTPQAYADPLYNMMIGTKLDTYTTGTSSIATSTVTGSGTSWTSVEGLGRMSNFRMGNSVYTVKSVDSDTQLTIYENAGTVTSSTYEITLNNLVVQFYQIPDAQRLIYYRYFRIPTPLNNDYDIPDMPHEFHWLLVYGALSFVYLQKGDINKSQIEAEQRFVSGLSQMKLKLGSFAPDRTVVRRSTDAISRRRRFDGLEPSNYDRRYSA